MIRGFARWIAVSLVVLAAGPAVFGQPGFLRPKKAMPRDHPRFVQGEEVSPTQAPKYIRFDIEGNPEEMLGDFLKSKFGQDLLKKVLQDEWQKLLKQPDADIERLLKEKAGNGPFRKLIEEFLKDPVNKGIVDAGVGGEGLRDIIEKFGDKLNDPDIVDKIAKNMTKLDNFDPKLPKIPFHEHPPEPIEITPPDNVDKSLDEQFGEWLKDWLTQERQEQFLDAFKETPALQEAIVDLARSLRSSPDAAIDNKWLPKISDPNKWKLDLKPPKLPWELGQMPKLPTIKMPTPPRLDLPMPKLGPIHMPQLPNFAAAPEMPGGAPRVSGASDWLILGGAVLAFLLAYFFLRKFSWGRGSGSSPFQKLLDHLPADIQTRAELRRAFDLLALSRLGEKARPWNHRQIAGQLGDSGSSRQAAHAFAHLYEIARYTPGDERLTDAERAAVRQSLAALTGAAA